MAYTKYSLTPSSNNAAPPDGAPEGMLPSAVNDTMRDMMAQIRDCGDGIRGGTYTMTAPVITGGSINNTPIGASTANTGAFSTLAYTGTLTGGTGVVNLGSGQFYKDASGRIGVGVTPSAFSTSLAAIQLGFNGSLASRSGGGGTYLTSNAYFSGDPSDTASNGVYIGSSLASTYLQTGGVHAWYTAPTGTAGNAITFTERMRIDSSGNVGIGTSSPAYPLQIAKGNPTNGYLAVFGNTTANGNGAQIAFDLNAVAATAIGMPSNTNALAFYVNSNTTERMRIDSSGNLLVNRTTQFSSGQYSADFGGTTRRGATYNNTDGNTGASFVSFGNAGTVIGTISQNGASNVSYVTSSDYRLKENIAPMTGALDTVAQLKPVTYKWKIDGSSGQGFIAHELQSIVPDCVTGEKDAVDAEGNPKYQGIDTSFLVATLTAAIQEQQVMIETLTTRLNALEGK